jgi:uncharacterized protein YPO0396
MTEKTKTSGNPALVEWPRDEWGNLSALRQALLTAAATVRGNDEKLKVFLQTLGVAAQHSQARFVDDKKALQAAIDEEEARIARINSTGRKYGTPVA